MSLFSILQETLFSLMFLYDYCERNARNVHVQHNSFLVCFCILHSILLNFVFMLHTTGHRKVSFKISILGFLCFLTFNINTLINTQYRCQESAKILLTETTCFNYPSLYTRRTEQNCMRPPIQLSSESESMRLEYLSLPVFSVYSCWAAARPARVVCSGGGQQQELFQSGV